MLYEKPKSILEEKINAALGTKQDEQMISDLIKLSLLKSAEKKEDLLIYTEVYNLLGLEKFTELVTLLNGKSLVLPTKDAFKDTITLVLCYYYHMVQNKDWSEIKNILCMQDLSSVKMGIKARQLDAHLNSLVQKYLEDNKE